MIHQGHPYKLGDVKVIALESSSGQSVRVGIVDEFGWFSQLDIVTGKQIGRAHV